MLTIFSIQTSFIVAIVFLILFSLTVQMSEGATFSVVPFINKKAIGSVSGIVGAGGNVGAFLAVLLLKSKSAVAEKAVIAVNQGLGDDILNTAQATASSTAVSQGYLLIGFIVVATGIVALSMRFSTEDEKVADIQLKESMGKLMPIKTQ